jgi:MoaA/NifB/PqqE/SkfB family radical SAM enzyme
MSNDNFKGFSAWNDYAEIYQQWSNEINPAWISLFGGEPMLNPTFKEWVIGLRKIWPNKKFVVATNGSRLRKIPDLYDLLLENKVTLGISLHNKTHRAKLLDDIKWLFKAPLKYEFDNSNRYLQNLTITDANNLQVQVSFVMYFHEGPVIVDPVAGTKTLHQSDPNKAHEICHSKYCHVFYEGKLYKCGLAALFPVYDDQFNLAISQDDRNLIQSYKSLSLDDTNVRKKEFFDTIRDTIDQCKFCPENYQGHEIHAEFKNNNSWPINS